MDTMVSLILNGSQDFTVEVLVRLFVFVISIDVIGMIASAIMKAGRM